MTRHGRNAERAAQPNVRSRYEVTDADLPLSCPMPGMQRWNSHPRVYLELDGEGRATCPYCSAVFTLAREPQPGG